MDSEGVQIMDHGARIYTPVKENTDNLSGKYFNENLLVFLTCCSKQRNDL